MLPSNLTTSVTVLDTPLYLAPEARLDLFSTSQKDVLFCHYRAPYFAYEITSRRWGITQGCCNHWDCPRCGQARARKEYGRIVEGCRTLEHDHELYFITLTCKGKSLKLADAMKGYLTWTNRLLSALRADAKKRGVLWSYVQVTEQQGRGHPHSHVLTSYFPEDMKHGFKQSYATNTQGRREYTQKPCIRSDYLSHRVVSSGLGEQYDISIVNKVEGASRYVAKYLFHPDMFKAKYPKGWKRVRYSQNFPILPKKQSDAMVLLTAEDWRLLSCKAVLLVANDQAAYDEARYNLHNADCILSRRFASDNKSNVNLID